MSHIPFISLLSITILFCQFSLAQEYKISFEHYPNGKKKKCIEYIAGQHSASTNIYLYNSREDVIKITTIDDDPEESAYVQHIGYDEHHRIIQKGTTFYEYNGNGTLKKCIYKLPQSHIVTTFMYNKNGRPIKATDVSGNFVQIAFYNPKYVRPLLSKDSVTNEINEHFFDNKIDSTADYLLGKLIRYSYFTYDAMGNLLQQRDWDSKDEYLDSNIEVLYTYKYNTAGEYINDTIMYLEKNTGKIIPRSAMKFKKKWP